VLEPKKNKLQRINNRTTVIPQLDISSLYDSARVYKLAYIMNVKYRSNFEVLYEVSALSVAPVFIV